MADLLFYTKRNCGLCDRLWAMISAVIEAEGRDDLSLVAIDIEGDLGLLEQFRFRVPVVVYEDAVLLEGRPDEQEVRQALRAIE
ncbi:MAG: glutaredoxin family protein [Phycisphaerales bacterium]|nr:glutaredoxin family protein [Phycisphaerales bacterium]